jgi:hypothetical protein
MRKGKIIGGGMLFGGVALSHAAVVSWGSVGTNIQAGDLITGGSPFLAQDSGAGPGATIGDNVFVAGSLQNAAGTGLASNTNNGGFYTGGGGDTGSAELNTIMNSHSYLGGGALFTLTGLTVGNSYDAQFIAVGDTRGCCASREQFVDDGNDNISGAMVRSGGDWVVGSFVADAATQTFNITGANDPGLSAIVVRDMGAGAVPEPSTALLSLAGLLGLALRRRR